MIRGGSWNDDPDRARSAYRNRRHPADRNDNQGFRLVLPGPHSTRSERSRNEHQREHEDDHGHSPALEHDPRPCAGPPPAAEGGPGLPEPDPARPFQ